MTGIEADFADPYARSRFLLRLVYKLTICARELEPPLSASATTFIRAFHWIPCFQVGERPLALLEKMLGDLFETDLDRRDLDRRDLDRSDIVELSWRQAQVDAARGL